MVAGAVALTLSMGPALVRDTTGPAPGGAPRPSPAASVPPDGSGRTPRPVNPTGTGTEPSPAPAAGPPGEREQRPTGAAVFADEFDGRTLSSGWQVGWPWGRTADHTADFAGDGNVSVAGGRLRLTQRRERSGGREYTAGVVHTPRFAQRYGYVEVRGRVAAGAGQVTRFMLHPASDYSQGTYGFQVLGRDPFTVHMTARSGGGASVTRRWRSPVDLSTGDHTFALEWTSTYLAWYVDGIGRHRIANDGFHEPMWMLMGVHVGGEDWWGRPDASTRFPTRCVVDHVRIWTAKPSGRTTGA